MIARRLPLALFALALLSLILGGLAPPHWQGLPATGALLLLILTTLQRLNVRWRWPGTQAHSPPRAQVSRARRRPHTPLHLLIASEAAREESFGQSANAQALGFWQALAASGNQVRLYGLDPELRLLAVASPARPLAPPALPGLAAGPTADLKAALARLCRQAHPGSILVVMAPLDEGNVDWLVRLDLRRRGLQLWLVDTALTQTTAPDEIRNWRDARRYAETWQTGIRSERLAARLERGGIHWLPACATADLQTRLVQLWNADESGQTAD